MTDRVRALSLRVRARRAEPGLKEAATGFVSKVLSSAVEGFRAEHKDKVAFVRKFELDLRMLTGALAITREVDAVAQLVRTHLEALVSEAESLGPSSARNVVVFESAAVFRAAYVLAAPADADAWYFVDLKAHRDPGAMLGLPDVALACATLAALCARLPDFERALARNQAPELVTWLQTLDSMASVISGREAARPQYTETPHPRADRLVAAAISSARAIVAQTGSRAASAAAASVPASVQPDSEPHDATAGAPAPGEVHGDPVTSAERRSAAVGVSPRAFTSTPTRIARAAYLTSLWLEIDVGQALYLASLREGAWIARALARAAGLASPNDDALCSAIGGEAHVAALPEIAPTTVDEACAKPLEAWLRSAARRRLEGVDLTLAVERWGGRRLLVVRGARCGAAIGALSADTIEQATAALRRVTTLAPSSAVLRGSRALVELDSSRRIVPTSVPGTLGADGSSACSALLVEAIAGAALELYALCAGLPGDAIADSFAVDGRILEDDELLLVEMDAKAIDIGLRIAGLDASPGWLPWRNKKLEIEFTGLQTW